MNRLLRLVIAAIVAISLHQTATSQSLSVNTDGSTADPSALLDVKSTGKGVLIPRMGRADRNAIISPATGLLIFQDSPDSTGFYYYNGSAWTWIFAGSNADSLAWKTNGNNGLSDAGHFIGTRDNVPFNIRVNDQKAGRIDNTLANTFWGFQAANANTTGSSNTASGYRALYNNLTGSRNIAVGENAMYSNTTEGNLVAVGNQALYSNTSGSFVTAIGDSAMYSNSTGNLNSAFGYGALRNNTIGINNTAVGFRALYFNTTGINNNAMGVETMYNNSTGSNNTAYGFGAMYKNTTGHDNTGLGFYALLNNSTGIDNTAVGREALYGSTIFTGNSNVGVGKLAGRNTMTGSDNTFIGSYSAQQNTTGSSNVSIGRSTIFQNTTGSSNTVAGYFAMTNNTTGYSNVAVGVRSLFSASTSNNLVAIGDSSLLNSTGTGNTAIGSKAGYNLTTGNNNVFLGYQAGYNETTGSNKLYIANNTTDPPIIYGDFSNKTLGLGTITPNSTYGFAKVEIASEGFGSPADLLIRNAANSAGYAPGLVFQHARGTLASPLTVINSDYLGAISTMNYDGSNYILSAGLDIFADGPVSANIVPTRMHFNTMNSTGGYSARLTIKNDGKTGIGTTNPSAGLDVGADFKLGAAGSINTALIKSTQPIDVGFIAANSDLDVTVTVTNAGTANSAVFVSPVANIEPGIVIAWARVSAINTVLIRFRNTTFGGIDPVASNYVIAVLQ